MAYKLLVGGYTEGGLRVLSFQPDGQAKLEIQQTTISAGSNPSWVIQHHSDDSLLFVGNEVEDGRLIGIKLSTGEGGIVKGEIAVNVSSGGSHPAHLKILNDSIVIGNYVGSSILDIPYQTSPFTAVDTAKDKKAGTYIEFSGTGPDADRQEKSHPHEVYQNGDELLIPDLGADKTWRVAKDASGWKLTGAAEYPAGSGPRHVLVHDGVLYTVLELSNQLSLHKLGDVEPSIILSTFSSGSPPDPLMLAAEILLSPNKVIYVSNRNDPSPQGDTLAVYSVPTSKDLNDCKLINEIRTGLNHIRGMNISKDGKFLAAAGKNSNSVKIFEILGASEKGDLKEVASVTGLDGPTSVIWI